MEAENYWVGREKQRYDFVFKYTEGNSTSRGYTVHKFVDRKGRRLLVYSDYKPDEIPIAHRNDVHKLMPGDCFTCKATVLRHDINTFKYGSQGPYKETILSRIKFGEYLGRK